MVKIKRPKSTILIILTFFLFYIPFSLAETKDLTLDGNNFQIDLLENDNIKVDLNGDGDISEDGVNIVNERGKIISFIGYSTIGSPADTEIRPAGSYNYKIKFTSKSGIEYNAQIFCYNGQTFSFGRYSGSTHYKLATEEDAIINKNEYFIVYKDGYSHILQFKSVSPGGSAYDNTGTLTVKDIGSATLYEITYTDLQGTLILDDKSYIIRLNDDKTYGLINGVDYNGDGQISSSTPFLLTTNDGTTISSGLSLPVDFTFIPSGQNMNLAFTNKGGIQYNTGILRWDGNKVMLGKNVVRNEYDSFFMDESYEITQGDHFVITKNGYSHIIEYNSLDNGILTLTDVGDSSSYEIEFTPPVQETCSDAIKNQNETDIDCGGVCSSCDDGESCLINSDCVSNYCNNNLCSTPEPVANCIDGIKNQDETDIDCGGSCPNCDINKACNANNDCLSDYCTNNLCTNITLPVNSTCGDSICSANEDCCLDCGCDEGFGCQNNTCISLGECSLNIDCDDNNYCTIDICSGIPKQCSYSQNESCYVNESSQFTMGEEIIQSEEITSNSSELQSDEKGTITTETKETKPTKTTSGEKAIEEPIEIKQKNIFQRIIEWIINLFK